MASVTLFSYIVDCSLRNQRFCSDFGGDRRGEMKKARGY
jgi:hypothetical protein